MRFHKPKGAIAIAIVSVGLSVLPRAVAASATSGKGSNPNSPFCKLEKASFAVNGPSSPKEKAVAKALEAGNWKVAQKGLLALENQTGKLEQELTSAVSSAPAKVKAAAQQSIKLVPAEIEAIKNSTSAAQFETAVQKVTSRAKFQKAGSTLETYAIAQCGTN